ncbi:MAG: hypothetical protein ABJF11_14335 [Reichenbachiella sp.]|uniref:hypothetical protein n=1 Tax=Reichenbachiella sp. TaxID=2184521 RepID=UPI0032667969
MRYRFFFICLWSITSCSESEIAIDTDRLGLHYFPLEVGDYRIYDVVEKNYSVLGVTEEVYELKESIEDSSLNASNNLQYIVHRSTRIDDTESWHLDSIWTARKSTELAILTENNVSLLKLTFPIVHDSTWDGNALNSLSIDTYRYDTMISDSTLAGEELQNLVKVVQNDRFEDVLGLNERSETYAPDIGLVIKESSILKYCTEQDEDNRTQLCDNVIQIESGREIVMTLKEYGKE